MQSRYLKSVKHTVVSKSRLDQYHLYSPLSQFLLGFSSTWVTMQCHLPEKFASGLSPKPQEVDDYPSPQTG